MALKSDESAMSEALQLARQAAAAGEVPVGAVVMRDGEILGRGFNRRESLHSPLAHAEILAIEQAAGRLGAWRLLDCTLYVTLEPCPMCAGAVVNARIPRVVFGARDPKAGAAESLFRLLDDERLNHRCEVLGGVLAEESSELLKSFFRQRRN